jgi:hypothetical protein
VTPEDVSDHVEEDHDPEDKREEDHDRPEDFEERIAASENHELASLVPWIANSPSPREGVTCASGLSSET